MNRFIILLSFLLMFLTSCNLTDSGKTTIINTTSNAVEVLFIEPFNVQELLIPANGSIEKEWTSYVIVKPADNEKYVYITESGDTFTIYLSETKQMILYVTNTTGANQIIVNAKDPTSGEFPVLLDAKNVKLEIPYIIGFELAIKELDPPVLSITDHKRELIVEDGKEVLRDFYLIRSPGY